MKARANDPRFPRAGLGLCALGVIGLAAWAGALPPWLAGMYAAASLASYVAYASDKAAAGKGARRTPERTLHVLDLLGGWPGALVAQRQFRHKTAKPAFQWLFWSTVLANLALLAWWAATAS